MSSSIDFSSLQNKNKIDETNCFNENIRNYIGKPIKHLILDANYSLKYITFSQESSQAYLSGLILTFSNNLMIRVDINEFNFVEKNRLEQEWDINKCILEKASNIEYLTQEPIDYRFFKQKLRVEYISYQNIKIVIENSSIKINNLTK